MNNALTRWHEIVRSRDMAALRDLLHPDAVFESPVVHTPQQGRDIVFAYLAGATQVLANEHFRYVGEWLSDDGAVLEFKTRIGAIHVNGVDIIRVDDSGEQIVHFKVMIRPMKAVQLVHQMMAAALASK